MCLGTQVPATETAWLDLFLSLFLDKIFGAAAGTQVPATETAWLDLFSLRKVRGPTRRRSRRPN